MTRAVFRRAALRGLLDHAYRESERGGREVVGWLVGFFDEGEVLVADAAACTKYRRQTAFGAEADPAEEAEVAARYPRQVGIVGLYHSHPFGEDHSVFHSGVDTDTLRIRAGRHDGYLSVVTDGRDFTCFTYDGGPVAVRATVREVVPYKGRLSVYRASLGLEEKAEGASPAEALRALRDNLLVKADRAFRRGAASLDRDRVVVPSLAEEVERSELTLTKDGGWTVDAALALQPMVYAAEGREAAVIEAVRNETGDMLTWLFQRTTELADQVPSDAKEAVLHPGHVAVEEGPVLPRRVYRRAGRSITLRK